MAAAGLPGGSVHASVKRSVTGLVVSIVRWNVWLSPVASAFVRLWSWMKMEEADAPLKLV